VKRLLISLSFLLVLGLTACTSSAKTININGFNLTLPTEWVMATGEINDEANIELMNENDDAYMMAFLEDKSEFEEETFEDYVDIVTYIIAQAYTEKIYDAKPVAINIDNHDGLFYDFTFEIEGENVYMQTYLVETNNHYGILYFWSNEKNKDQHSKVFNDIALSLQEII